MHRIEVGDLLVASSLVEGSVLNQCVCLLVYGDDENAIGLMLNRPMQAVHVNQKTSESAGESESNDVGDDDAGSENSSATQTNRIRGSASLPNGLKKSALISVEMTVSGDAEVASDGDSDTTSAGNLIKGSQLHFGGPLAGPLVAVHGTSKFAEAEAGEGIFVAAQRGNLEGLLQQPDSPYRLIVGHLGWTLEQLEKEIEDGVWHRLPATADVLRTDDAKLWPSLIQRATGRSLARWIGATDAPDIAELN
ncbi:MAG: YqgE/AlgH family protein [Planctomycetota bacterium]